MIPTGVWSHFSVCLLGTETEKALENHGSVVVTRALAKERPKDNFLRAVGKARSLKCMGGKA